MFDTSIVLFVVLYEKYKLYIYSYSVKMGVRGLLSTCLRRQEECTETIDLVEEAINKSGIELLVDFYAFQQHLLLKFWTGLCKLRGNNYLSILGGEYDTWDNFVKKLITDLKDAGIHLVFYIDGSRGSSTEAIDRKLDTWMKRHEDDVKKMTDVLNVLWRTSIQEQPFEPLGTNIKPVVLEDQVMAALKHCGCEIHQIPAGEADLRLIRALHKRKKACAILSNDSDFCVFKNSKFIPMELFDIGNDLKLGEPLELPKKPFRLKVKIMKTEKVMSMLQINSHPLYVDLCIISGNDYTGPFMNNGLSQQLNVPGGPSIENYARWIRHYMDIQNHPLLADKMNSNHAFRQAVYYSRDLYTLKGEPDQPPMKDYFSQIIYERIRSGKLPSDIMGMHNNFYWYRMLLEDNRYGQPCAERALTSLRAYIYRMVLPRHEYQVIEYGRIPLRKAETNAADDGFAPPIDRISADEIVQNVQTFHAIMCHRERGYWTSNWFNQYGLRDGFTIHLLRYFLIMNWGCNLHITVNEYLVLVATVLGTAKETQFQVFVLKPTVRCVTIGNWFQDLYRHACMLGSLLHLKNEFPLPSDLFSGSVWAMMYRVAQDYTFNMAANQLYVSHRYLYTHAEMNKVFTEKRDIIRQLGDGYFPF